MAKKDKFSQLQVGRADAISSFQEQAKTVAAITQHEQPSSKSAVKSTTPASPSSSSMGDIPVVNPQEQPRFMRLPNPQIPLREYNLVSNYCNSFSNMTRQDFVELAIIEKLHRDQQMPDDEFNARQVEIRSRPSRGQRKGTKQTIK